MKILHVFFKMISFLVVKRFSARGGLVHRLKGLLLAGPYFMPFDALRWCYLTVTLVLKFRTHGALGPLFAQKCLKA